MQFNFIAILVAAFIPVILGFFWYHPKAFGNVWMRESGLTQDQLQGRNMLVVFGISLLLSFFLSFFVQFIVIHQFGALGMIGSEPDSENILPSFKAFMDDYGTAYRTFKHGALHGALAGVFMVLPILGINGLFERQSWKHSLVNAGFWTVALTLMGGIVCGWV